ncbi:Spindle-pole body protein (Pcp1) [Trichuris trichiura]|uniref:Spindle-pole body protein (Pcp1) n=1 Tax=Trichuris trichiura TaxID=36087 RepID=A0A077Z7F9_TRITR|nr:Spindle-pole body protein (Pcp1) [Trichuris trichiura]
MPGVVADACNPATRRLGTVDGLRPGGLDRVTSRRPSVRVKSGVNMVTAKELTATRLVKEGRNWPRAETQQAKVPASLQ